MIYLFVIIFLLILIFKYDIIGSKRGKNICFFITLIILVLVSGLRYRLGLDTTRYIISFYHETPKLWALTAEDLSITHDPLFLLLNSIVLTLEGRFFVVQIIQSLFVNYLLLRYIKKHSSYIFTCVLFYIVCLYFVFNMEEMRASMSVVVCLFANDYILEKKWFKGLFLYIVGCLFHSSTFLVILLIPLLFVFRINFKGILLFLCCLIFFNLFAHAMLEKIFGLLIPGESLSEKMAYYVIQDGYTDANLNLFGYLGKLLVLIYPLYYIYYLKKHAIYSNILQMEPLLMIFILFYIIETQLPIFYRFVRFYHVYFIIFTVDFIILLVKKTTLSLEISIIRTIIILIPLLYTIIRPYFDVSTYARYYPYNSILDKKTDLQRERVFSSYKGEREVIGEY